MTKAELVLLVSETFDVSKKEAETMFEAFETKIVDSIISGEEIPMFGGKFKISETKARAERQGVNPKNTTEKITISAKPAGKKVKFTAMSKLKAKLV